MRFLFCLRKRIENVFLRILDFRACGPERFQCVSNAFPTSAGEFGNAKLRKRFQCVSLVAFGVGVRARERFLKRFLRIGRPLRWKLCVIINYWLVLGIGFGVVDLPLCAFRSAYKS